MSPPCPPQALPLRVLYVHPVKVPNPEANLLQAAHTCRALAEAGCEVFLIVAKVRKGGRDAALRALGVEPHPSLFLVAEPAFRLKNASRVESWFVRAGLMFFLRSLAKKGRTVLYLRTLRDSRLSRFLLFASRLLKAPLIYEAHKIYRDKREDQGFHRESLQRVARTERRVLGKAAAVVASHPLLADELRERGLVRGEMIVAENAVEEPRRRSRPRPRFDAAYVGSLFPWKGVDVCLAAAARGRGRTAIVGGNPPSRLAELRESALRAGLGDRIVFFGQVRHRTALALLHRARVALLPLSDDSSEGASYTCPLKMLEAMVRGVPLVAADTPALRTFLGDGENALLYPPGDAAALAERVARLLDDEALARRIGQAGRAFAAGRTFLARARKIVALAEGLLGRPRFPG